MNPSLFQFLRRDVTEVRWMLYLYRAAVSLSALAGILDLVGWLT